MTSTNQLFKIIIVLILAATTFAACKSEDSKVTVIGGNTEPTATNVAIAGTQKVYLELTGSYTFTDTNSGDTEGSSTYQWYRADTSGGSYVAISGATSLQYILAPADETKYIKFEVMPVNVNNEAGTPSENEVGPIQAQPDIRMFSGGEATNGNFAAIHQPNCDAANIWSLTVVKPLISTSTSDIKDLVGPLTGSKVVGPDGVSQISATWTGLWDGTIDMTLLAAGVLPTNTEWFSGSNSTGVATASTCTDWTNGVSGAAQYGWPNVTTGQWVDWGAAMCTNSYYMLCVGW